MGQIVKKSILNPEEGLQKNDGHLSSLQALWESQLDTQWTP